MSSVITTTPRLFQPARKPINASGIETPEPHVRNADGIVVGGSNLAGFGDEVERLAHVLFHHATFISFSASTVKTQMEKIYGIAKELTLEKRGWTCAFTQQERELIEAQEMRAKRQAEMDARNKAVGEKYREAQRIDRQTRDELAAFKPSSPSIQRNSASWAIERGRLLQRLNETRAKHELSPLPY